jgi:hypothetical protein
MVDIFDQLDTEPKKDIFDQIAAPPMDAFDQVTSSGDKLTPENYGRVAAARIVKAQRDRGADLNQNEQAAIMDSYRQAAGLPTLSNVDTFKESQKHIAAHQGEVLNLARSTASAFERQAVNFVAPVVDLIHPDWGKSVRQDIAAMNPFDPERISGKAGGAIASLPLLLAGGGVKSAAAIFGLQSMTESLATSEDTGVTGAKKWLGAAGEGAITAGSVLAGGKIAEWLTGALAGKLPRLAALIRAGDQASVSQVITREAAQAGINLPTQGAVMLAGTISSNLLASQTTDPNRKWDDGLGETAFNVAAMTIGNHLARAAEGVRSAPGAVSPPAETGLTPEKAGPTVFTPKPRGIESATPFDLDQVQGRAMYDPTRTLARRVSTPEASHPLEAIGTAVSQSQTAGEGISKQQIGTDPNGRKIMLVNGDEVKAKLNMNFVEGDNGEHSPGYIPKDELWVDSNLRPHEYEAVAVHESTEAEGMAKGKSYDAAHVQANEVEKGVRVGEPLPAPSEISRPKSVVMSETDIHHEPEGFQAGAPHATYDGAVNKIAAGVQGQPGRLQASDAKNPWVRQSKDIGNAKRVLLVQFSTDLINAGRPRSVADDYYDKLYANRPGYSKPPDFWELPQWIGVAAHNLSNSDVYVVRDLAEARKFLASAKYDTVAMSALDVNTKLAQGLIDGYKGRVAVGGYTDMTPFQGRENVKVYKTMPEFIKDQGRDFKEGTDYRHFKGTEVVPRLSLSEGCLHNCAFCGVEGKGKAPREISKEAVDQQIKSFADLKARLVYINDKTFWQAKNSADLPDIAAKIKAQNPDFEGFIVQTSAAQMKKMTPEVLKASGVKYVELGVESYNNDILKAMSKPANETLIDEAVQKIREAGLKFIPNIMIGLPGETPETYARTLSFLEKNRDIISHVNTYNVALYEGSKLSESVGGRKLPSDADENVIRKSWQATPEVDQAFHDAVMKFGSDSLDRAPGQPPAPPEAPVQGEMVPTGGANEAQANAPAEPAALPPRPPNEPPPHELGGPSPEEPEGKAGHLLTGATVAAYTGDTRTAWDKLGEATAHFFDGIRRYSGRMFPTLTRLARGTGEKGATYISSKIWAVEKAGELARTITGGDKILDLKLGALLTEDNLRSLAAKAAGMPQVAGAAEPHVSNKGLNESQIAKIKAVSTTIGAEGSPFQTEADYQAALRDPTIQAALQRVKAQYGPIIDELFRKAQGLASDAELAQRGFRTGVRINLMAVDPNAADREGMVITGSKQGNLRNPMRGKTPFSKEATGTGNAYETRFSKIIENSLGRTADISFKNDFIASLKQSGLAQTGIKGQLVSIGKHTARPLPLSGHEDLFVRSDVYGEVRQAFDVDSKEHNALLRGAADLFNKTALASLSEAAYHLGNQASVLTRAPGTGLVLPKLLQKTWGLIVHDPTIMAQASELAKMGAWRQDAPEMGAGSSKFYKYTLGIMGRVIGKMDQAGRLVLDDAFKGLAAKGVGLNTETNRRDFINQIGQYNRRAQSKIIALARDTGLGPFATAGTNFYTQGIRSLFLSPGMQATSTFNAARLRAMVAGRFAAVLGAVAVVNYLRWGQVLGGNGVPVGAIRLEDGTDDQGRKTVRFLDIASLMNVTRGLRAVGARALIEGNRQGKTGPEIASDAAKDAVVSALGPFEGPIVRAGAIAVTGYDTSGFPVGPPVAADENAPLAHLKAAALAANPLVAHFTDYTKSGYVGKFQVQERKSRSVAEQIASREAIARVPRGSQTRAEMDETAAERGYRESWAKGDKAPLIEAYKRGDLNEQRAHTLITDAYKSDLARTVHHLPIDDSLRVYDAATPAEKADLRIIMLQHITNLAERSPLKAKGVIAEYKKRGLL